MQQLQGVSTIVYMPHGRLASFCRLYQEEFPEVYAQCNGIAWRCLTQPGCSAYAAEHGQDHTREVTPELLVQLVNVKESLLSQTVHLLGWTNPEELELPDGFFLSYDIRDLPLTPRPRTLMLQRALSNLIADPSAPGRARPSGGAAPATPGTPVHPLGDRRRRREHPATPPAPARHPRRRRRNRERRQLFNDDEEEEQEEDEEDEDHLMEIDDLGVRARIQADMGHIAGVFDFVRENAIISNVAPNQPFVGEEIRRIQRMYRAIHATNLETTRLATEISHHLNFGSLPEHEGAFARALAGQLMGVENRGPNAEIAPEQEDDDEEWEWEQADHLLNPQPPARAETAEEKARRLAAALKAGTQEERHLTTDCPVCANPFATALNADDETRVLRVSIVSCTHDLCVNCAHRIMNGGVSHGRSDCPLCKTPIRDIALLDQTCADCLMIPQKATSSDGLRVNPPNTVLDPCGHACFCTPCAQRHVSNMDFSCPVCQQEFNNWRPT